MTPQGARDTQEKTQNFLSDPSAATEGMAPSQGGLSLHKYKHTKRPTRTPARMALPIPPPPVRPSGLPSKPSRPYRIHSNLARPLPWHAPTAARAVFSRSPQTVPVRGAKCDVRASRLASTKPGHRASCWSKFHPTWGLNYLSKGRQTNAPLSL